jgi:hypothetical protein
MVEKKTIKISYIESHRLVRVDAYSYLLRPSFLCLAAL